MSLNLYRTEITGIYKKGITGGGSGVVDAWHNQQNKIDVIPSKDKCLYVVNNVNNNSSNLGGQIIFSTDITLDKFNEKHIKEELPAIFNKAKEKYSSSCFYRKLKVMFDKFFNKNQTYSWTIGNYVVDSFTNKSFPNKGHYETFNENSIVIDCIGVPKLILYIAADELRKMFNETCILIKTNHIAVQWGNM